MANSRQETINTFEKGMIKDLNPINTPNNVLTDCVNGTILTYDGNEYQLQNDKGNIALEYSKLPEGYLPVGTSSYGDILYIVAYNPLTNRTQIGTFPSPKTRITANNNDELVNESILSLSGSGVIKYTEAMKNQKMQVFYGKTGDLIIYPGDQYLIEDEDLPKYSDYEKLQYFILTDEKKLIDITDQVKIGSNENDLDGMYYVTWDVPGYLCTQWRLPQINENGFSIQPKSVNLSTKKAVINCQIGSTDELIDNAYKNGTLCASEISEDDTIKTLHSAKDRVKYDSVNYYSADVECDVDTDKKLFQVTVAPEIKLDDTNILLFDQFKQASEAIDLENTFNKDNTFLGNEYYNYIINDKLATLNFNINCNIVSNGDVELYVHAITLADFINSGYNCNSQSLNWIDLSKGSVFDGLGQNIMEFKMPEEEQIYVLRFRLTDGMIEPVDFYKPLICSEIMNQFDSETYPLFTDISINQWINELNRLDVVLEDVSVDNVTRGDVYAWDDCDKDDHYWTTDDPEAISSFVTPEHFDKSKIDTHRRGYVYKINGIKVKGVYRQKYLYNFCVCNYTSDSTISMLNKTLLMNNGSEKSLDAFSGNVEQNCYVERQYQDQSDVLESGAEFDFKSPCDKRGLLYIHLWKPKKSDDVDGSEGTVIRGDVIGFEDVTKDTVYGIGCDLEPENGDDVDYYKDIDDGLKFDNGSPLKNHVDNRYYLIRGAESYEHGFLVKNAEMSVKELMSNNRITRAAYKFMEHMNVACVPTVIDIEKSTEAYGIGISTNSFGQTLWRKKNDGDRSNYVFGVTFRTYDSGIFFVPLDRFSNLGNYTDSHARKARTGWDVGFQEYLTVGKKKDNENASAAIHNSSDFLYLATETWWKQFKNDTDGAEIAATAGIYAAAAAGIEGVALGAYAGITAIISASSIAAAGGTAAGVAATIPVAGWIAAAAIIVATAIAGGIVAIVQANKENKEKYIALGPFIYKPVYDALWKFTQLLKINTKFSEFKDGCFLKRTALEDTINNLLSFDIDCNTQLSSLSIRNTSVTWSPGMKFPKNDFNIFTNETFDIINGVVEKLKETFVVKSEYKICDFINKGIWPYKNPNNYSELSLTQIDALYDKINDISLQQSKNWLSSIEYQYVSSGMSIGYYAKKESNALLKTFVSMLHNTYHSDQTYYVNKDVASIHKLNADVALDTLEEWWAICNEKGDFTGAKGNFDFSVPGNDKTDPRFKLFWSKDQKEFSVINLTEDDEA